MKSPPVCIDTQICVWGIKSQAKPGQKNESKMIARAQQLFADLSRDKVSVCIPSIVLAELLVHEVGSPNAEKLRADLSSRFNILVFNIMCAKRHAEMLAKSLSEDERTRIKNLDPVITKAKLRADLQVVSTMLGNGIKVLYTEDPNLAYVGKMAGLTVNGLPGLQETIFDVAKANEPANPTAPPSLPKDALVPQSPLASNQAEPTPALPSDKGSTITEGSKPAVAAGASPSGAVPADDKHKTATALNTSKQTLDSAATTTAPVQAIAAKPAISPEPPAISVAQVPAVPTAPTASTAPKPGK